MKRIDLSIVIPAYNEEIRLLPCLDDIFNFFKNKEINFEIIIVSDGSTDNTEDLLIKLRDKYANIRLLSYFPNRGKGFAVKTGVLHAFGELIAFVDADGSTPFAEMSKLILSINSGADIAIGSRAKPSEMTKITTKIHRKIIGRIFNFFLTSFLIKNIYDSQCGFKLFKSNVAHKLFEQQKSSGFSFDYEILFLAIKQGFIIDEIPVNWSNVSGFKVNLISDSLKMLIDIFRIRLWHFKN